MNKVISNPRKSKKNVFSYIMKVTVKMRKEDIKE